jgi:uncharacterized membrane protein (DUF485 family)
MDERPRGRSTATKGLVLGVVAGVVMGFVVTWVYLMVR